MDSTVFFPHPLSPPSLCFLPLTSPLFYWVSIQWSLSFSPIIFKKMFLVPYIISIRNFGPYNISSSSRETHIKCIKYSKELPLLVWMCNPRMPCSICNIKHREEREDLGPLKTLLAYFPRLLTPYFSRIWVVTSSKESMPINNSAGCISF